ncbi:hypothetical protein BUE80_DR011392 [Diplocarpon rosae]|nr:hypothetical protein BUE80_DR011392 [Diplocarpon rosae]
MLSQYSQTTKSQAVNLYQWSSHKICTILNVHTTPGGQNPDWYSESGSNYAAFLDFADHQERIVWLSGQIAEHYTDSTWVAGYTTLNESCDSKHWRLPAFYDRLEPRLRKVDPNQMLWLVKNIFAMEWKCFNNVLPNNVYILHDYSLVEFPTGDRFKRSADQLVEVERKFLRRSLFMQNAESPAGMENSG